MGAISVLLSKPEDLQQEAVARALAQFRQIPLYDAARLAKNCWGIAAENLDQEQASKLIESLKVQGLGGLSIAGSDIFKLPAPEPIAKLEFDTLEKERLALIAAAFIEETVTKTTEEKKGPGIGQKIAKIGILMTTGIPLPIGKTETVKKIEKKSNSLFYADLIFKNPARRLRINAQEFNYSYLKERMSYAVFNNFKLFLSDLAAFAPGARRNLGAKCILEGHPLHTLNYGSLEDLDRESRWLMSIR